VTAALSKGQFVYRLTVDGGVDSTTRLLEGGVSIV